MRAITEHQIGLERFTVAARAIKPEAAAILPHARIAHCRDCGHQQRRFRRDGNSGRANAQLRAFRANPELAGRKRWIEPARFEYNRPHCLCIARFGSLNGRIEGRWPFEDFVKHIAASDRIGRNEPRCQPYENSANIRIGQSRIIALNHQQAVDQRIGALKRIIGRKHMLAHPRYTRVD